MSRPFIELYIDSKKVQFKEPPKVLITYAHQDLHNPTIVKNSFSKTVTIEGTPYNNQIFGCFYDMTRLTGYNDITMSGAYFNASRKVPFELYRNGEMMEQGYIKLDKVTKKGNEIQYDITLYGGLGQFLYNLQYNEDGEQMRLSDLDYGGGDKEFDIEITNTTIINAWKHINGTKAVNPLYDTVNFAPSYNGIPSDFSADKVAIDVESFKTADDLGLYEQFEVSKDGYETVDGWLVGELKQEYDEWQMNDLRSYLQRPVFRVKKIIEACANPENNGGYTVDFDNEFFNESNPYYEDAWLTLPMVTEIVGEKDDELIVEYNDGSYNIVGAEDGDTLKIQLPFSLGVETEESNAYELSTFYRYSYASVGAGTFLEGYSDVARYIQLLAYDANGKIVGGSTVKSFHSTTSSGNGYQYQMEYDTTVTDVVGTYKKQEDGYRFFDVEGNDMFTFTIDNLEYSSGMTFKFVEKWLVVNNGIYIANTNTLFDGKNGLQINNWVLDVYNTNADVTNLLGRGYAINKKTLLNSEKTPCDYFLSYLKMFNLHIWKDMYEKRIYIRLRKNFFKDERYDLNGMVDRGSNITITPLTFENKWYNFSNEEVDSGLAKEYIDEYGIQYGCQKVDTNYNFDTTTNDLFSGNVYKTAIQIRRKSKYNINVIHRVTEGLTEDITYPPYFLDGVQTLLFNGDGDTVEGAYITPKTSEKSQDWWDEKYYDITPKPLFVDEKNQPVDGTNVLLFYNGCTEMKSKGGEWLNFYVTDDIPQFEVLNDGEPCWIWTYKSSIAKRADKLPIFSRYLINTNGWVTHSWDFGTPKSLYVPDYSIDDTSNIYTQYWQSYIRDMYNVDTRIVECNVLLKERVVGDWLRRFYYWDGSYFILNKISDYDVTSNDTTKCEFVRVQNMNNYLI